LLERLNVKHLIMLRKINFYKRLLYSSDVFIHNMFCTFLYNACDDGILFKSVFIVNVMPFTVSGQPFRTMFYISVHFGDFIVVYFFSLCIYSLSSVCLAACFGE